MKDSQAELDARPSRRTAIRCSGELWHGTKCGTWAICCVTLKVKTQIGMIHGFKQRVTNTAITVVSTSKTLCCMSLAYLKRTRLTKSLPRTCSRQPLDLTFDAVDCCQPRRDDNPYHSRHKAIMPHYRSAKHHAVPCGAIEKPRVLSESNHITPEGVLFRCLTASITTGSRIHAFLSHTSK